MCPGGSRAQADLPTKACFGRPTSMPARSERCSRQKECGKTCSSFTPLTTAAEAAASITLSVGKRGPTTTAGCESLRLLAVGSSHKRCEAPQTIFGFTLWIGTLRSAAWLAFLALTALRRRQNLLIRPTRTRCALLCTGRLLPPFVITTIICVVSDFLQKKSLFLSFFPPSALTYECLVLMENLNTTFATPHKGHLRQQYLA